MVAGRAFLVSGLLVTSACVAGGSGDGAAPAPSEPSPVAASAPTTPLPADPPDESSGDWTVEGVSAERAAALSALTGVRATRHPDVIFAAADGRVWVSKAAGAFESYDPTTGLYRAVHGGPLGGLSAAQEIAGPAGWREGGSLVWNGIDPFVPLVPELAWAEARVVEVLHEARPAWEIVWSDLADEERMIVDRATGLVVEHRRPTSTGWSLTDVRPIDEMPDEFPGEVPDGVEVEEPFSVPLVAVPLVEAARRFTPGLVAPEDVPPDSTVFVYDVDSDPSEPDRRREEVTMYLGDGFDTTRVVVSKFLPHADVTIVDGDVECYDVDDDGRCDFQDRVAGTVRSGALAGREFTEDGGGITVFDAGRTVRIFGIDPSRTRRIADTFVAVRT